MIRFIFSVGAQFHSLRFVTVNTVSVNLRRDLYGENENKETTRQPRLKGICDFLFLVFFL